MKNIIAILLLVSTMLPVRAASPACQPLAGFIKGFSETAKDNKLVYSMYRLDGSKAKEFLMALDSAMGAKSEDEIYDMMTSMLVIISPTDQGYVGIIKDEDICLGAVIPMDSIVDALRKLNSEIPV